jgi:hypothetical protein
MSSISDEQFSYYGEAFGHLDEVKKVLDLHQRGTLLSLTIDGMYLT